MCSLVRPALSNLHTLKQELDALITLSADQGRSTDPYISDLTDLAQFAIQVRDEIRKFIDWYDNIDKAKKISTLYELIQQNPESYENLYSQFLQLNKKMANFQATHPFRIGRNIHLARMQILSTLALSGHIIQILAQTLAPQHAGYHDDQNGFAIQQPRYCADVAYNPACFWSAPDHVENASKPAHVMHPMSYIL
jgi:hypothetical protein